MHGLGAEEEGFPPPQVQALREAPPSISVEKSQRQIMGQWRISLGINFDLMVIYPLVN